MIANGPAAKQPSRFAVTLRDGLLFLVVIIWGSNFALVKQAFDELPPLGFNAVRLTLASLMMLAVLAFTRAEIPRKREWRGLLGIGIVGHCIYQISFVQGLARTSVANSSLILGCVPIIVLVLNAIGRRPERVTALHWTGVGLSAAGIYLVVGQGAATTRDTLVGDLLTMVALWSWAVYTIGSRSLLRRLSPVVVAGYSMAIGTVFFLPWGIADLTELDWMTVSWRAWAALVASAVLSMCVANVIWYSAVQRIGSTRTAVYSNMTPLVAMFVAATLLDEPMTRSKLIGAVVILLGLGLTRIERPVDEATETFHYGE